MSDKKANPVAKLQAELVQVNKQRDKLTTRAREITAEISSLEASARIQAELDRMSPEAREALKAKL